MFKQAGGTRRLSEDLLGRDLRSPDIDTIDLATSWARNSRSKELMEIVERGYSLDSIDKHGNTLLLVSAQSGNVSLLQFFLKRGADINAQNKLGNTALHYTMHFKHEECTQALLKRGADDLIVNGEGLTAYEGLRKKDLEDL